ncbi:hypothetical protein [Acinetobacter towneri]|uniref:hypothetical protein n=1 Tax=Acinetobacter towneri TaxID=202956 RepID=UPI002097E8D2|nr:hypothetical protein [Acinetobacter towneri]MCO8058062.1 hypothetical protein [Acinetobacter towneri]MCO8063708.1 hypothetical protein [Acinetobacter towneri]
MAKKTLKEKINCVKYFTLLFAVLYFLIGAWLKSDGPNFDPDKAYELIKDTLTITAAFLAPVAAFVLFVDWKDEHRAKSNEKLSAEIRLSLYDAYIQIASYTSIDTPQKMGAYQMQFEQHLNKTKRLIDDIYTFNDESRRFKSEVKDLLGLLEQGQISWSSWVNNRISVSIRNKAGNVQLNFDNTLCDKYSDINNKILSKLNQLTALKV